MFEHSGGLIVRLAALCALPAAVAVLVTPTTKPASAYCFNCYDSADVSPACQATISQASPGYTWHEDDEGEDWEGNVYGDPHSPVNCVGNSHGNMCGQLPGAHANECPEGQQDLAALQLALGQRDFNALAVLVSKEDGHVKFNVLRGSVQTTDCSRRLIRQNIPLTSDDVVLLQKAIGSLEQRRAMRPS
jgi:hypothetical protein